jgi:circadian clock protein KaiB
MAKTMKNNNQPDFWELRLYVAGQTARAVTAFSNLKKLCEEHLQNRYRIKSWQFQLLYASFLFR